jgi:uncharacterized protein (DUF1330 family)
MAKAKVRSAMDGVENAWRTDGALLLQVRCDGEGLGSWYRSAIHCFTVEGIRKGNDMKKGYWVVAYRTVGDEATMKNYVTLAVAALGKFGARTLVPPGSAVTAHEVGLQQMTVVVEFDSYEIALAAYESADYKKALAALGSGVERDFRIAEGV